MVPRMLEACVHVTMAVLSESNSLRSDARSLGLYFVFGIHHLIIIPRRSAIETQGAMLASWSTMEMMISDPGWKLRVVDRLRYSCVVEDPRTVYCQIVPFRREEKVPMFLGEALMNFAA